MRMILKLLLSVNLALCLLASSTMAMEERGQGRIPSRLTTTQSVRGKSESRPATATRGVKRPRITIREAAAEKEKADALALATKKAKLVKLADAAKKALRKPSQEGAGVPKPRTASVSTARTASSQSTKTSGALQSTQVLRKKPTKPLQVGAGVLTAQPRSPQKAKQTPMLLDTQVVAKKDGKGDQERSGSVDQANSSSRALSLGVITARSQQNTTLITLDLPLVKRILQFLVPQTPQDPREICRITRTSSKINKIIDEDHLFWRQIYQHNYPEVYFNAMTSEDKEKAVAQFKEALRHLRTPIDPETGRGYRKAFKFYSTEPVRYRRGRSSWYFEDDVRKSVPAIAILLRSSNLALYVLEKSKPDMQPGGPYGNYMEVPATDFGDRGIWSAAFLEAPCFNEDVYVRAFSNISRSELDDYVERGNLAARHYRMTFSAMTSSWGQRPDFLRKESDPLLQKNYFPALLERLEALAGNPSLLGEVYKQDPLAAAQEYERCAKLFHSSHEKLLRLKRAYTGERLPKNWKDAILWLNGTYTEKPYEDPVAVLLKGAASGDLLSLLKLVSI